MEIFPAIDLKDGACVRLLRGDMQQATHYNADPAAQARCFIAAGCRWLHIVDLNGAVSGTPVNRAAVAAILTIVRAGSAIRVQLGGGVRDRATLDAWLAAGVDRIVLGTIAATDPDFVRTAVRDYPGRIAVGIDARNGMVATQGWVKTSSITALDLARAFDDIGVAAIIYTDIDRDGALAGPNLGSTVALAGAIATPVIISGGIATLADIAAIRASAAAGIMGAIIGRALYDGRITLAAALNTAAAAPS